MGFPFCLYKSTLCASGIPLSLFLSSQKCGVLVRAHLLNLFQKNKRGHRVAQEVLILAVKSAAQGSFPRLRMVVEDQFPHIGL